MSNLEEPSPPPQRSPADADPIRLWLGPRCWPISWMRSMSGFVATMSWIALAYQLYYLRQFFQWGFEYDRVNQWFDLSGHFSWQS